MLGQLADVGPRNKRLLAGPGKDDDANRLVILNVMKRRPQLLHGRHVERVEHLRPVDGDVSDRVFLFEKYIFAGHEIKICPRWMTVFFKKMFDSCWISSW